MTVSKLRCSFRACLVLLLVLFGLGWSGKAQSQTKYPSRAIHLIVSFSAGGAIDITSRVLASNLSERFGVPVNVINKPGGNSIPATLELMNSPADGYTLFAETTNTSLLVFEKDLPFKIMGRSFIDTAVGLPMMFVVPAAAPWHTLKGLADALRKNAEGFTWVSAGSTGVNAYVVRQFFAAIGIDVLKTREVMVKGGGEQITLVAGQHAQLTTLAPASCLPSIRAGTLRALATTTRERIPQLPDVPTTRELGYPSVDCQLWIGHSGPPNLPAFIMDVWNQAVQRILKDPKVISQLDEIGARPLYRDPGETRERVERENLEAQRLWGMAK